jgi:hypothetical protein
MGNNCWYKLSPPLAPAQLKDVQVLPVKTAIGLHPVPTLVTLLMLVPVKSVKD